MRSVRYPFEWACLLARKWPPLWQACNVMVTIASSMDCWCTDGDCGSGRQGMGSAVCSRAEFASSCISLLVWREHVYQSGLPVISCV